MKTVLMKNAFFAPSEIHTSKGHFTLRGEKTNIREWKKKERLTLL